MGRDELRGGPGADELRGGPGRDLAHYAGYGDPMSVDLAAGVALTPSGEDTLFSIRDIYGSTGNDVLRGNANDNRLGGGPGNDEISGRGGDDMGVGGGGDDTVVGGAGIDGTRGDDGIDTCTAGPKWTASATPDQASRGATRAPPTNSAVARCRSTARSRSLSRSAQPMTASSQRIVSACARRPADRSVRRVPSA